MVVTKALEKDTYVITALDESKGYSGTAHISQPRLYVDINTDSALGARDGLLTMTAAIAGSAQPTASPSTVSQTARSQPESTDKSSAKADERQPNKSQPAVFQEVQREKNRGDTCAKIEEREHSEKGVGRRPLSNHVTTVVS